MTISLLKSLNIFDQFQFLGNRNQRIKISLLLFRPLRIMVELIKRTSQHNAASVLHIVINPDMTQPLRMGLMKSRVRVISNRAALSKSMLNRTTLMLVRTRSKSKKRKGSQSVKIFIAEDLVPLIKRTKAQKAKIMKKKKHQMQ